MDHYIFRVGLGNFSKHEFSSGSGRATSSRNEDAAIWCNTFPMTFSLFTCFVYENQSYFDMKCSAPGQVFKRRQEGNRNCPINFLQKREREDKSEYI